MGKDEVYGLPLWSQISSSEVAILNIPISGVWAIRHQSLWALLSLSTLLGRRERDQSSASPHKTPSRTRPLKWGNIRVTLIWAKFQILFSKLLSALENKSDSRKSETEVFKPWKLDAFLLYAFSDHRLMSKFDHKNHSGSLIFSLMACF